MTDETKQVHHADCGAVGDTGEHGELGTNAAGAVREASSASQEKPVASQPNPLVTHISR
jgi:hypothetical protein